VLSLRTIERQDVAVLKLHFIGSSATGRFHRLKFFESFIYTQQCGVKYNNVIPEIDRFVTAAWLSPGGSSTVHIYTKQYTAQYKNIENTVRNIKTIRIRQRLNLCIRVTST
jgi:hypothetical protein